MNDDRETLTATLHKHDKNGREILFIKYLGAGKPQPESGQAVRCFWDDIYFTIYPSVISNFNHELGGWLCYAHGTLQENHDDFCMITSNFLR